MKTVLVIEDEADIRNLYTEYLRNSGYQVLEASDGITGAEKALKESWDILLLDIMLPGQDGISLLRKIKSDPKIKDRPVIALTNLNIESVINDMFDQGADGFLVKSDITPDRLVNEVQTVLQKYS